MKMTSKILLLALGLTMSAVAQAKSLVIVLSTGTKIYYKITSEQPPRMVIADDGTFTLNTKEYKFSSVKGFTISTEDYSGESGTKDGIVSMDDRQMQMQGDVRIYTLDGKLVRHSQDGAQLDGLKSGIYVITNGVQTLKIQKR